MIRNDLLQLGITALANTPAVYPALWFNGHFGAAVLAAHFIREFFQLEPEVDLAIEHYALDIVAMQPDLFTPIMNEGAQASINPLAERIAKYIGSLTSDGHDVIFASLALRALELRPTLSTPPMLAGLLALLDDAQHDDAGRYFGVKNYILDPVDYSSIPDFETVTQAAEYAMSLHDTVYPDGEADGRWHYFAGNKLHDITHAHALLELARMGYDKIAHAGIEPLRKQFFLCSLAPDDLLAYEAEEVLDPWGISFWQRSARDPHQIKLAYSVMCLTQKLSSPERHEILRKVSKYWLLLP